MLGFGNYAFHLKCLSRGTFFLDHPHRNSVHFDSAKIYCRPTVCQGACKGLGDGKPRDARDTTRQRGRKERWVVEPESNGLKAQHGHLLAYNLAFLVCEVGRAMPASLNHGRVEPDKVLQFSACWLAQSRATPSMVTACVRSGRSLSTCVCIWDQRCHWRSKKPQGDWSGMATRPGKEERPLE